MSNQSYSVLPDKKHIDYFGERHKQRFDFSQHLLKITIVLPLAVLLLSVLAYSGYFLGVEAFYRPVTETPATHPMTLQISACLSLAIFLHVRKKHKKTSQLLLLLTILLIATAITSNLLNADYETELSFATNAVEQELASGKQNSIGANTTLSFLLIAMALFLSQMQKYYWSQISATMGLLFPIISVAGYTYGVGPFYGEMSVLTVVILILLSISALLSSQKYAIINILLCNNMAGKTLRMQVLLSLATPFIIGYIFVNHISNGNDHYFYALIFMTMAWISLFLLANMAMGHETLEGTYRQQQEKLYFLATHDALTGLPNRRQLFSQARLELDRQLRTNTKSWFLMVDIDHFKEVNDKCGHQVGDQALKIVARIIRKSIRSTDLCCRYGGEEFAILLTDANLDGATRIAETIRAQFSNAHVTGYTEKYGAISLSIGIAKAEPGKSLDQLLKEADSNLYKAKIDRNTIVYDDSLSAAAINQ